MSYIVEEHHRDFLVDSKLQDDPEIMKFVEAQGIQLHFLKRDKRFCQAIQGHPDIIGCPVFCTTIVDAHAYENNRETLEPFRIKTGTSVLGSSYPDDVYFNVAVLGKFAIHGQKIDSVLEEELHQRELTSLVVKQGYSKCNIVIVDEHSIITSDRGIWKTCKDHLDILLVSVWQEIQLEGLGYGFLGGSSLTRGNNVCFTGEIEKHPDFLEIRKFLEERQKTHISMRKGRLIDVGSFVPLYRKNDQYSGQKEDRHANDKNIKKSR